LKPYLSIFVAGLLLFVSTAAQSQFNALPLGNQEASPQAPELAEAEKLNGEVILLFKKGKYDEALPLAARVVAITEKILGPDHPHLASALRNLAEIQVAKGKREDGLTTYRRYLSIHEKLLGADNPKLIDALDRYLCLLAVSGQRDEALEVEKRLYKLDNGFEYGESLDQSGKKVTSGRLLIGRMIGSLAQIYPDEAKRARLTGSVVMKITADETGKVIAVKTLCGHPTLAKAAEGTIRKARFTPRLVSGKPVKDIGVVIFDFSMQ
jgi:TonB family protein